MSIIRAAKLSDAKKLAVLAEATFRDTFSEENTSEDMNAHCRASYGEEIQAREISDPSYVTIVAEIDEHLVAYAQLRWGEAPECVSANSPGEIQRLYVDKSFHGSGLAHTLMSECLNA
jgi:ribosomal protein S18 acetylase RimI-like enzyme